MNAHNEQHDPASAVVKQNLTTQPAAAQEAVGWQWRWLDTDNTWSEWVDGGSRKEIDARIARWKADGEDHRMQVRPLFAAPVTAAPAVAYMIDGRTEQGLTFDKTAAETMAFANGGTVRALGFVEGIPAAPGIDMGVPGATLTIDGKTLTVDEVRAALIDASPNGTLNEQFGSAEGFKAHFAEFIKLGRRHVTALYNSPRDEISMTDTGCWIQYAMQLLQLDSPKGGGVARDAARLDWLESEVRHYGDGHTEPREAYVGFNWQESRGCEVFPGVRAAIDAAMQAQAGDAGVQP